MDEHTAADLWSWLRRPPAKWTPAEFEMQERWYAFFAGAGPLPIPPDDYARHWALEGPGRPEIWPHSGGDGAETPMRRKTGRTRHGASCEGNRSRNE